MSNSHRERFGKLTFGALANDEGLTLDTSAFQIFLGDHSIFMISFS